MSQNNIHELTTYAIFHKPTNKWVRLEQDQEFSHLQAIVLIDHFSEADKFVSKLIAEIKLQGAYMFEEKYGKRNFLEFEVVKFKVVYTMLETNE
jgi:hypothetical protein